MIPAPKAMPATGADAKPAMPVLVGKTATPMKLAAELTTSRTPTTHNRILSARGFHFAIACTTCLPPFSTAVNSLLRWAAAVQVQLIDGVHAISNRLVRKNLRTPQPDDARLQAVRPGEGALVLGVPQDQVGELVRGHHASI